jgi:hypothetical protein
MSSQRTWPEGIGANHAHANSDNRADRYKLLPLKRATGTIDTIGTGIEVETRQPMERPSAVRAVTFAGRNEGENAVTPIALHSLVRALAQQAAREAFVTANQGGTP